MNPREFDLEQAIEEVDSPQPLKARTKLRAFQLSLAKWHPSRGCARGKSTFKANSVDSCGLCVRYRKDRPRSERADCGECPLNHAVIWCLDKRSPYARWVDTCDFARFTPEVRSPIEDAALRRRVVYKRAEAVYQLVKNKFEEFLESESEL